MTLNPSPVTGSDSGINTESENCTITIAETAKLVMLCEIYLLWSWLIVDVH